MISTGMNKKFLNKVVDHIVYETKIDFDRKVIVTPIPIPPLSHSNYFFLRNGNHLDL